MLQKKNNLTVSTYCSVGGLVCSPQNLKVCSKILGAIYKTTGFWSPKCEKPKIGHDLIPHAGFGGHVSHHWQNTEGMKG